MLDPHGSGLLKVNNRRDIKEGIARARRHGSEGRGYKVHLQQKNFPCEISVKALMYDHLAEEFQHETCDRCIHCLVYLIY